LVNPVLDGTRHPTPANPTNPSRGIIALITAVLDLARNKHNASTK
jgi:hypothetical protein